MTGANANDGCQTEDVLRTLVITPPATESLVPCRDPRAFPRAQADGAHGNSPTQERAERAGFRLQVPKRGKAPAGVGKIRNAVERCHQGRMAPSGARPSTGPEKRSALRAGLRLVGVVASRGAAASAESEGP